MKVIEGRWNSWRPAQRGRPASMIAGPKSVTILLPVKIPTRLFRIRTTFDDARSAVGLNYLKSSDLKPAPLRVWRREHWIKDESVKDGGVYDMYGIGSYIIKCLNGAPISIQQFADSVSKTHPNISISTVNSALEKIEWEGILPKELPASFRNPKAFLAAIKKNPSWFEVKHTATKKTNVKKLKSDLSR